MDPNNNQANSGQALPQPVTAPNGQASALPTTPGTNPAVADENVANSANQPLPTNPVQTPGIAEDADVIEQEWVDKAKAIVESNKQDPYKQNEQMNKIKADYIKKRYDKDIKVSD